MHRGTGAIPAERFAAEVPLLGALPRQRFDTAYVEARRVHVAIPQIEWRGVRYSVPPRCLGQRVEVRQEVGGVEHRDPLGRRARGHPRHLRHRGHGGLGCTALRTKPRCAASSRSRGRHLSVVVPDDAGTPVPLRLDIEGDVDVEVPTSPAMRPTEARS